MKEFSNLFIKIQAGYFLMGADALKEEDPEYCEQPEREVWLSTYQIQKVPVTIGQWKIFLKDTNYDWRYQDLVSKRSPSDDHPIVHVTWFDAFQFTVWLSEKLDSHYSGSQIGKVHSNQSSMQSTSTR